MCRYYAFELCALSLRDWVDKRQKGEDHGPIPSDWLGLNQLALALQFLHEKKYIHRDLSPENILISVGGDRMILSDFGLSKAVHESGSVSISLPIVGKENWFAPERISNRLNRSHDNSQDNSEETRVTIASDTWAMGCLFYYFITRGHHPFYNKDWILMQNNILNGNFNLESKYTIDKYLI